MANNTLLLRAPHCGARRARGHKTRHQARPISMYTYGSTSSRSLLPVTLPVTAVAEPIPVCLRPRGVRQEGYSAAPAWRQWTTSASGQPTRALALAYAHGAPCAREAHLPQTHALDAAIRFTKCMPHLTTHVSTTHQRDTRVQHPGLRGCLPTLNHEA